MKFRIPRVCFVALVGGGAALALLGGPAFASSGVHTDITAAAAPERVDVTSTPANAAAATAQPISVAVMPGRMWMVTPSVQVSAHRDTGGDAFVVELPATRVIDARGSLDGWTVDMRVRGASACGSMVPAIDGLTLKSSAPVPVDGWPDGLHALGGESNDISASVPFFAADQGGGSGTYEAAGEITIRLSAPSSCDSVELDLGFSSR